MTRVLGGRAAQTVLTSAAYASSTWDKTICALNCLEDFELESGLVLSWPVTPDIVSNFLHWCVFDRKLKPSSIVSYMSHIKLIHNLRGLDGSACDDFACKVQIRGAKNLQFYEPNQTNIKKVMSLPLLKIFGHNLASTDWSNHSKSVVWAAACTAFFGSFRFGELLSKEENSFNAFETLMWSDVKFFDDRSIQVHNKIPKNRTKDGEFISIFPFLQDTCCPVQAIVCLFNSAKEKNLEDRPVFTFENGSHLTLSKMNNFIVSFLEPQLGDQANFYSCKSFRAALPSALASHPHQENDVFIKRWGRWNSEAFERYTRLSHSAKREIFARFAAALFNSV